MRKSTVLLCVACSALLSGCGTGSGLQNTALIAPANQVRGIVHGGQQPLSGAVIQLYPVGTTGYGSAGTGLISGAAQSTAGIALTDANGNFNITGKYTCPSASTLVYLTATGGNPGLTAGTNNSAIVLMAALGQCGSLSGSTVVIVNEVTTVASAYALAQFFSANNSIGSYSYSTTGLVNAFATVNNLVNIPTGTALAVTPNGNGVVPQAEINSLADALAPCVNSASNTSAACTSLFSAVPLASNNTLAVAVKIAQNPGANVGPIYALIGSSPPFVPSLGSAPNDWTVALSYNDGGSSPRSLAIDSVGDVWIANFNSGGTNSSLSKISPTGIPLNGSPFHLSTNGTVGVAIDNANDAWIINSGNSSLVGYSNNGNTFVGPITGLNSPDALAFDPSGNLWIANFGNSSVVEFNPGSDSFIGSPFTAGGISTPYTIAMDYSGNAWVGNGSSVTELSNAGTPSSASPISGNGVSSPGGIAIDGSQNVWVSNAPTGNVAELSNSGAAISSGSGYTAGGVGPSNTIAIDGNGDAWIADRSLNQLAQLAPGGGALSPSTGYRGGGLNLAKSLAIDGSGDIWVANLTATTTNSITTTISEFVGLAAPVITPLSFALEEGQLGTVPGTPIPINIVSGAVPYYTPNSAYSAELYATGGNSGTFVWTLSAGSLPSPLTLSSIGLISGTTALASTTSFTAQACDSANLSNCATKSFTISANTAIPASGNESALTGAYAMQFSGFKNGSSSPGQVFGSDFVASVTFNGSGLLSGEIDSNNKTNASVVSGTLTGYYAYGSDNRGTMVIIPSGGTKAIEFAFSGGNFSGSTPQTLTFIEFDDTVSGTSGNNYATGSGIAKLQPGSFSAATLNQSFVFGLQGETPCAYDSGVNPTCPIISPFGPLSVVGKITGNSSGSITFGEEDGAGVNTSYTGITLSGSYTNPDSFGRGTLTLNATGTLYPASPTHFIYYIVSSGELYLMSSDGHLTTSLLSGDALVQTGSFSNTTLSGNFVAYEQSPSNGDGISMFPTALDSSLIYLTVQAGPQFAITIDENNGQEGVKLEQSQGPFPYSIDSNGRLLISGGPTFYLANSTQAFGTEQPSTGQDGPGLIVTQQQTPGTFGCGLSTGTFSVGTAQAPIPVNVFSGYTNLSTATLDESALYGVLEYGETGTVTCSSDSLTATTGRFTLNTTFGTNEVGYIIVPNSKYVLVPSSANDTVPTIFTINK